MKYILRLLKYLGYFIAFLIATLIFIRLTLDPNQIKGSIEKTLTQMMGVQVHVEEMSLQGILGIHIGRIHLKVPQSEANKKEWEAYRAYKKAQRLAKKNGEKPPEEEVSKPLLPIEMCVQDLGFTLDTFSLIRGEKLSGPLEAVLFDCTSGLTVAESTQAVLKTHVIWSHKNGIFNQIPKKLGSKLKLQGNITAIALKDLTFLKHFIPVGMSGEINSEFDIVLAFARNFNWRKKGSNGEISIDGAQLTTNAGNIQNFQVPNMKLGTLRAMMNMTNGKVDFTDVNIQSNELKLILTGDVKLARHTSHITLASHLSADLLPSLFQRAPDFKTVANFMSKYFKKQTGGGYHAGILLRGKINRLRPTEKLYSPYSKEGRLKSRKNKSQRRIQTRKTTRYPKNSKPSKSNVSPTRDYNAGKPKPSLSPRDRRKALRKKRSGSRTSGKFKNKKDDLEDQEDKEDEGADGDEEIEDEEEVEEDEEEEREGQGKEDMPSGAEDEDSSEAATESNGDEEDAL